MNLLKIFTIQFIILRNLFHSGGELVSTSTFWFLKPSISHTQAFTRLEMIVEQIQTNEAMEEKTKF